MAKHVDMKDPTPIRRADRGAALVELAFISIILVLIVLGTIDLTRAYRLQIRLENAAREGASFGQLHPNDVDGCPENDDDIVDHVGLEDASLAGQDGFIVTVLRDDGSGTATTVHSGCGIGSADAGEPLRVEAQAEFDVFTPFVETIVGRTLTLTGAAEVRVQG